MTDGGHSHIKYYHSFNISRQRKNVLYAPPFTCSFLLEVFSVSYCRQIDGCLQRYTLSVIWGWLAVICRGVYSVSYLRLDGGFLHGDVLCQLFEAGWRLYAGGVLCQLLEAGWRLSAGGCTLSITLDSMAVVLWDVLCQLLQVGWRLSVGCVYSVSYMSRIGVYLQGVYTDSYLKRVVSCLQRMCNLSVTCGRLTIVCSGGWTLSFNWGRMTVACKNVCTPSVTCGMLVVVCKVCVHCQLKLVLSR